MRILQVCNVGNIVGGTAACAWSITRALPEHDHHVVFRSKPTAETIAAFEPVSTEHNRESMLLDFASDFVILHNQQPGIIRTNRPVLSFIHSHGSKRHAGNLTVYASQWLADQFQIPDAWILHQGVPVPPEWDGRDESQQIIVGRICTPQHRKWPPETVELYSTLARVFPHVWWAFVGCPEGLPDPLHAACRGQTFFHPAEWGAQRYLRAWTALLYHNRRLPESFGRTCAEAMLVGCFPLVDPQGGFLEQFPHNVPWRVRQSNPMSFITALHHLLEASAEERYGWRCDMIDLSCAHFSHTPFRARLNDAIAETITRHARQQSGSACSTR